MNIYQKDLDKACFEHDMAYGDFKDLPRRTTSDKVLLDKTFNIAECSKYCKYQRGIASVVYKFFDKKSSCGPVTSALSETLATLDKSAIKYETMSIQQ